MKKFINFLIEKDDASAQPNPEAGKGDPGKSDNPPPGSIYLPRHPKPTYMGGGIQIVPAGQDPRPILNIDWENISGYERDIRQLLELLAKYGSLSYFGGDIFNALFREYARTFLRKIPSGSTVYMGIPINFVQSPQTPESVSVAIETLINQLMQMLSGYLEYNPQYQITDQQRGTIEEYIKRLKEYLKDLNGIESSLYLQGIENQP